MKKTILLFAGLLLASITQAQITLNSSNYTGSVTGTDSLMTLIPSTSFPFPSLVAATNGSWDLSTMPDSGMSFAYRVSADTAAAQFADSNTYSFSTYTYQGNVQAAITSTGLVEYGVDVQSTTFTVGSGTITVPVQHAVFSAPYTVIKFPATMSTTWSSTYESDFNFMITYFPLYSNAAGVVKSFITETDSVKGWGKMRVPGFTGGASSWFNVLQVQTTITVMDSFLINGAVPIAAALSALGVTEGQTTNTYQQSYYRTGEVTPFAKIQYPDATFSAPSRGTTNSQRLINTGIANVVNNSGVNIYPNPVTGNEVSIDRPAAGGAWSYELIDMNGRNVTSGSLQTNGKHAQLSIPSVVTPGIYYIRINNNGNQICVRSIDIAK